MSQNGTTKAKKSHPFALMMSGKLPLTCGCEDCQQPAEFWVWYIPGYDRPWTKIAGYSVSGPVVLCGACKKKIEAAIAGEANVSTDIARTEAKEG